MRKTLQVVPAARRSDLVIQEADGETLIYDTVSHKAHCLNPTAALVWKHCDGKRTAAQVAERVSAEAGEPVTQEVVWLAVELLEKRRLLEGTVSKNSGAAKMSRRELARKVGIATALMLPFIATINAPAALQSASCAGIEEECGPGLPSCCPPLCCTSDFNCGECPPP